VRGDDIDAIYDICLRTSDAGADATRLHDDPRLPGHVWAAPYVVLEPGNAFVVADGDDRPVGYVLGALESRAFEARLERDWWPALRPRYPLDSERREADQRLVRLIHHPPVADAAIVREYPSHLHIDLLPEAQGRGAGRRLVATLLHRLAGAGSRGVHLGVEVRNERAIGFYRAMGFTELARDDHGVELGHRLGLERG
jgi:ribosomal protein S18 acetylase RimI-like enzyme